MSNILFVLRCLLSGLSLLVFMPVAAQSGIWSSAKQMTSSTISAIVQDQNGYVWVGTEYGLNRFDGYRYSYFLADDENPYSLNDNCITTMFVDSEGTLWVGTRQGLNRYLPDMDMFASITFPSMWQPRIQQLSQTTDGRLLCATSGFGLWEVKGDSAVSMPIVTTDGSDDYYQTIAIDPQQRFWKSNQRGEVTCLQSSPEGYAKEVAFYQSTVGEVRTILPHTADSIYIVCDYGLVCYDGHSFKLLEDTHGRMELSSAIRLSDGRLLVGTVSHGLWSYDANGHAAALSPVRISSDEVNTSATTIRALFEDRDGNVWAGCYQRGVMVLPKERSPYMKWSFTESGLPSSSEITSVAELGKQELLVTLSGYGLYRVSATGEVRAEASLPDASAIYYDRRSGYWATTGNGLYSFDPATGKTRLVLPMDGANVRTITADKLGNLYLSTYSSGICVFDTSTGNSRQMDMYHAVNDDQDDRLCNDWVLDMLTDSRGLIWCATASGVSCYDPRANTFIPYGWAKLLDNHLCQCLAEDADGNILIGTHQGAYIYDLRTRQLSEASLQGLGLLSRSISAMVAMPDSTIWMSTSRGIWFYDQKSGVVQPCAHIEGAEDHEYNQGVATVLPSGNILFGMHDGFVGFNPERARSLVVRPDEAVLTTFLLGNDIIKPGQESGGKPIFTGNVTKARHFSLSYDDNSFTMEFSTMTYCMLYRPRLEYSVNDGRWQDAADQSNAITFNHLSPGEYNIRVRLSYSNASSVESAYTVTVRPPWYASWWAYTLYILAFLGFLGLCFVTWLKQKQNQVEDEKMQLLIDATHDIRTPLTLILSPLHQLTERYQADADTSRKLQTINHNARRILNLVNQILDVRRYDQQQMPFRPQLTDLVRMVDNNLQGFMYEAQQRKIQLSYNYDVQPPFNVPLDRTQFEKVIVNIVGNSLKFTPDGGQIELQLTQQGDYAVLIVSDTGVGLPNGDTERIFHRFYQGSTVEGGEGTGIGLNLCLKVMQQHLGSITASGRADGQRGSTFTIKLPLHPDYELSEELKEVGARPAVTADSQPQTEAAPVRQPSRSQRILLVDDDVEITDYIANELSGRYRFQSCRNGLEALQLLLADPTRYDVLVSDIMMAEMDGLTLLRSIKSNSQIAHIPVVLLTSKTEIANRLEGLSAGADAYMAKPFVIDELRATIDAIIANTLRRRSKFGGNLEAAKAASAQDASALPGVNAETDGKLLERIVKVVNMHLSDADFGVDELCLEVGVSRSQLHRKMKELTGIGAGEFVRNIRLEQAARMLKETEMNVSQVAYAVGFSNLGHFSKIFRTHFGIYPSEYSAKSDSIAAKDA